MKKYESYCIKSNCFKYNFICLLLFCFAGKNSEAQTFNIDIESNKELNYSNLTLWAAHPWKKDKSDSVTIALKNEVRDSTVDVFFIHPTTYTNKKFKNWNASISDETINNKTDQSTILYQASVFNGSCRIFAPRYRQAHINAFYISKEESDKYFDIAYNDIRNAFLYYLKYYNHGRPIIIASHSQGTMHAGRLLKEFFENKGLINQLVCAYLVGMPIPEDYFSKIPSCKDSTQTGCFVGWRTFKKNYVPDYVKRENFHSIVTNPLSWTVTNEGISSRENKGGILFNFNKIIPKVVNAKVHDNILWTSKPDIFGKIFIHQKNYHIGDINLFYLNIRDNVKCRINHFNNNK